MNVADLFVSIGVKGADSAKKALDGTSKGLGDVASSGLAAKAAIVGTVYALERLMTGSAQRGMELQKFSALTGLSSQSLQQWQYAARVAGVGADEMSGSLKGVQAAMVDMVTGKGAPAGMSLFARAVGFDASRARDTFYVMEKLQEFAQKYPSDIGNSVLKSFNVGEGVIAGMRRNVFNSKALTGAPTYGAGETGQLAQVDVAWARLGAKIEMAMGHFTAKHGMEMIRDLDGVTKSVIHLGDAFVTLAEKVGFFEKLGMFAEGIANSMKLVSEVIDKIAGKDSKKGDILYNAPGTEAIPGFKDSPGYKFLKEMFSSPEDTGATYLNSRKFGPSLTHSDGPQFAQDRFLAPAVPGQSSKQGANVTVNQTIHNVDAKDRKQVEDINRRGASEVLRQLSAQSGG